MIHQNKLLHEPAEASDCEKHPYERCHEIAAEKLVKGGILVADNATNHYDSIMGTIEKAEAGARFDCLTVLVGNGEFI